MGLFDKAKGIEAAAAGANVIADKADADWQRFVYTSLEDALSKHIGQINRIELTRFRNENKIQVTTLGLMVDQSVKKKWCPLLEGILKKINATYQKEEQSGAILYLMNSIGNVSDPKI